MPPALREPTLYPGDPRADSEQSEVLLPEEPRLWLKGAQQERQEKVRGGCVAEATSGKGQGRSREEESSGFYLD